MRHRQVGTDRRARNESGDHVPDFVLREARRGADRKPASQSHQPAAPPGMHADRGKQGHAQCARVLCGDDVQPVRVVGGRHAPRAHERARRLPQGA